MQERLLRLDLYIHALVAFAHLPALRGWRAFTDIEFNPEKSLNCQARSCPLAVALDRRGVLEPAMASFEAFAAHVS